MFNQTDGNCIFLFHFPLQVLYRVSNLILQLYWEIESSPFVFKFLKFLVCLSPKIQIKNQMNSKSKMIVEAEFKIEISICWMCWLQWMCCRLLLMGKLYGRIQLWITSLMAWNTPPEDILLVSFNRDNNNLLCFSPFGSRDGRVFLNIYGSYSNTLH